jgi:hypothetical protein
MVRADAVLPTAATFALEQIDGDTYVAAALIPDLFVAIVVDSRSRPGRTLQRHRISEWLSGTANDSTRYRSTAVVEVDMVRDLPVVVAGSPDHNAASAPGR